MRTVHIGFPKTATTFLQTRVFPLLGGFEYFDKLTSARFFAPLINYDDTIFDAATLRRQVNGGRAAGGKMLYSYEGLTGLHYQCAFVNRTLIATRLKSLGFEKVIITIRNQFDALESAYKQYVSSGGVLKLREYLTFDPDQPRYLYPEYFDYHAIYRLYADTFGPRNVLLLQYEDLAAPAFLSALCRFLETEPVQIDADTTVNPSLSREKTTVLRAMNHVTCNSFRPSHPISRRLSTASIHRALAALPFGNSRKSLVDASMRAAIAAFYAESNDRLEKAATIALTAAYPRAVATRGS